jgi:outer membrane lipoprotein-sorting protein
MRSSPERAWITLFCGVVLIAGCARAPVAPPKPVASEAVTAESLVVLLQERSAAIRTMKALLSVEATGGAIKGTQRLDATLLYQRPGSLRLQAFARLGFPVLDLTLADDLYQVKLPMNGKLLKGHLTDLDRQGAQGGTGTPITLAIQATLGSLTGFSISPTDQLMLREENGSYVLDVIPAGSAEIGMRRLWFDRGTLEVARQDFVGAAGELTATILFQDYRVVGTTPTGRLMRAHLVRAEDKRTQALLLLNFREIILNPELVPQDWGNPGPESSMDSNVQKGAA